MTCKITPEQQADLQAHVGEPIPVQDNTGNVVCYMIGAVDFDDGNSSYNQKLNAFLKEGDESPRVEAGEAHQRMRQSIQNVADKYAWSDLIYTEKALVDFDSILEHVATDNPRAAIKLGEGLMKTCTLIEQQPEMGARKGGPNSTLRMFTFRGYAIYYRNLEQSVDVLRFLHHSLDHSKQSLD